MFSPQTDVSETNDAYVVRMDVPGVDRSDIDISVRNRMLTVSGRREERMETKDGDEMIRMERRVGEFSRAFSLPGPINENGVEAKYKNGVLTITIPKVEEKRKEIEIEVE